MAEQKYKLSDLQKIYNSPNVSDDRKQKARDIIKAGNYLNDVDSTALPNQQAPAPAKKEPTVTKEVPTGLAYHLLQGDNIVKNANDMGFEYTYDPESKTNILTRGDEKYFFDPSNHPIVDNLKSTMQGIGGIAGTAASMYLTKNPLPMSPQNIAAGAMGSTGFGKLTDLAMEASYPSGYSVPQQLSRGLTDLGNESVNQTVGLVLPSAISKTANLTGGLFSRFTNPAVDAIQTNKTGGGFYDDVSQIDVKGAGDRLKSGDISGIIKTARVDETIPKAFDDMGLPMPASAMVTDQTTLGMLSAGKSAPGSKLLQQEFDAIDIANKKIKSIMAKGGATESAVTYEKLSSQLNTSSQELKKRGTNLLNDVSKVMNGQYKGPNYAGAYGESTNRVQVPIGQSVSTSQVELPLRSPAGLGGGKFGDVERIPDKMTKIGEKRGLVVNASDQGPVIPAEPQSAIGYMRETVPAAVTNKKNVENLYKDVYAPTNPIDLKYMKERVGGQLAGVRDPSNLRGDYKTIYDFVADHPAGATWQELDVLRSRIGAGFEGKESLGNLPTADLKNAYDMVRKQMNEAVAAKDPALLNQFNQGMDALQQHHSVIADAKRLGAVIDKDGNIVNIAGLNTLGNKMLAAVDGKTAGFDELINSVPEDLREEVILDNLFSLFSAKSLDTQEMTGRAMNVYKSIANNEKGSQAIFKHLSPEIASEVKTMIKVSNALMRAQSLDTKSTSGRDILASMESSRSTMQKAGNIFLGGGKLFFTSKFGPAGTATVKAAEGLKNATVGERTTAKMTDQLLSSKEFADALKLSAEGREQEAANLVNNSGIAKKLINNMKNYDMSRAHKIAGYGAYQLLTGLSDSRIELFNTEVERDRKILEKQSQAISNKGAQLNGQ